MHGPAGPEVRGRRCSSSCKAQLTIYSQGPPGDEGPQGPKGPPGPLGESVSRLCSNIEGKMYRGVCFKGALLEENADNVPGWTSRGRGYAT